MELTPEKRAKLERRTWAIHFTDQKTEEKILSELKGKGHTVVLTNHLWQGKQHQMYNISFAAAEFVIDTFPAGSHGRILLRLESSRGWLAYMENGAGGASTVSQVRSNNNLFSRRGRYVPLSKIS